MLHARQFRRLARGEREHDPRKRLEDQVLRGIGEHRDEHEDGEAPRLRLVPHSPQRIEEGAFAALPRAVIHRAHDVGRRLDPHQGRRRDQQRDHGDGSRDDEQAGRRERIEVVARDGRRHDKPDDHHHPHEHGGRAPPLGHDALRQQDEKVRSRRPDPSADHEIGERGETQPRGDRHGQEHRRERRTEAAGREHAHAAEDPGHVPPALVGAVAPPGPQHLHRVMQPHEQAGDRRGQGVFDHHHPVERRRRHHDDGAERRLHEAEPQDAEPAQGTHDHRRLLSARANAVTIMPST